MSADPSVPDRNSFFLKETLTRAAQSFFLHIVNELRGGEVSFIQVGANDGVADDPLHGSIMHHPWRGILIEPVPLFHAALRATYANRPGLEFLAVACAEAPGTLPFYQVRDIERMTWHGMRGLSSLDRAVIRPHFASDEEFARFVEEVAIEVTTLDAILAARAWEQVDVLAIDAEGADFRVLQGFDVARYRPLLIIVEHHHLTVHDRAVMFDRLHAAGYARFVGGMDTLFYRPEHYAPDEMRVLNTFQDSRLSLS